MLIAPSVVIDNLDVFGSGGGPAEADSPLIIDADAVLPLSVSCERFKVIARRRLQELDSCGCRELRKLAGGNLHEGSEALRLAGLEELASMWASEALDHAASYNG